MIGQDLGRYHITGRLGEGGTGTVWKADDRLLGRPVALKLLSEALASAPDAHRQLLREARSASALSHPGVASVYDAGEADGQLYIAYELVEGETVAQRLSRGPLGPAEAVRIACAAAEALAHAHARGIVHRDISAGNLMVGSDGRVTLLDFGLAKILKEASSQSRSGVVRGTVPFMSPEVARGERADTRSDIYGLGAVLYTMITGSPPFKSERVEAELYRIVHEPVPRPRILSGRLPRGLERVILKALAKDPAARHASARVLAADLAAIQDALGDRGTVRERPTSEPGIPPIPEVKRLAVLPFHNLTVQGARKWDAFARGLTETVSARLARAAGVQVIPPSSLPRIVTGREGVRRLARRLGANLFLEGSVQFAEGKVRVAFSLFNHAGIQITGDTMDGNSRKILALEDRVVLSVVRSLALQAAGRHARLFPGSRDPAAHDHYLQALGHLQRYENEASVDGAITLLENLRTSGVETAAVNGALGRAYLAKFQLSRERSWEELAGAECVRALRGDPESPEVLVTLGQLHAAVGRYDEAVAVFRKAMRLGSDDPEPLLGMASVYVLTCRFREAEKACRQVIALRPGYWGGYNRLGVAFFKQGRYREAAEQWRQVARLAPDNSRGHCNLASAYYALGRYEHAIRSYRRSIGIQPTAPAYTSLGTVYFFRGRYAQAAEMFEKGAALQPFDPAKWGNLGDAYRWMPGGRRKSETAYDQAIRLMVEHLDLNSNDAKGWLQLASWLAKRGERDRAARALRRGLRLKRVDATCVPYLVAAYVLSGRTEAALDWVARFVRRGCNVLELERDPDLAALRRHARFKRIMGERMRRAQGRASRQPVEASTGR